MGCQNGAYASCDCHHFFAGVSLPLLASLLVVSESRLVILSAAGAKDPLCSNSRSFASRAFRALAQDDKPAFLSIKKEGENKGASLSSLGYAQAPQARRIRFPIT
jgi:hypothetical protein